MAESYHTANLGGTACLTPSPEDGPRPYTEALAVLRAAEEFGLQSVAKRAVYELTCSQDFWTAIEADRASVDISDGVLYQVGFMRYKLRHRWEAVLSDAPRTTLWRVTWGRVTRGRATSCHPLLRGTLGRGCVRREGNMRTRAWSTTMQRSAQNSRGIWDPLRHDVFARLDESDLQQWCSCCIREWETKLKRQREDWWTYWMKVRI